MPSNQPMGSKISRAVRRMMTNADVQKDKVLGFVRLTKLRFKAELLCLNAFSALFSYLKYLSKLGQTKIDF